MNLLTSRQQVVFALLVLCCQQAETMTVPDLTEQPYNTYAMVVPSSLLQVVNILLQTCFNKLE